jgi:hypothetical protein
MPKGFKREQTRNKFNMWFMCEKSNTLIEANTASGFNLKLRLHKKKCKECSEVKWTCQDVSGNDFDKIKKNHNKHLKKNNICQDTYELFSI